MGTINVAVINGTLMGNHQSELGEKLHELKYNICSDTTHLLDNL